MKQLKKVKLNESKILSRLSYGEMDYLIGGDAVTSKCVTFPPLPTTTTTSGGPYYAGCGPIQSACSKCFA